MITPAPLPQAARLSARSAPARGVVLHTTGRRVTERARQFCGSDDPHQIDAAAVAWYRSSSFDYFGGYLVGLSGTIYQFAPDTTRTQHAGELDSRYRTSAWRTMAHVDGRWVQHMRDPAQVWDWWDARWGRSSPRDIFGDRPNDAIGVDLLPDMAGHYTAEQTAQVRRLVHALAALHGFPPDRRHVVGHEDVDPCNRGVVKRGDRILGIPWDPGALDWSALALGER